MSLFSYFFANREKTKSLENRLSCRYQPSPDYGLQINVLVSGEMHETTVLNMSGFGLGLLLPPEVRVVAAEEIRVFVILGEYGLETEARVAHHRTRTDGTVCGIELKFKDVLAHQAYLQFLRPVAIGQSMRPLPSQTGDATSTGIRREIYQGESDAALTLYWQEKPETKLLNFEFLAHSFLLQANCETGILAFKSKTMATAKNGLSESRIAELTGVQQREGQRLLAEVTLNLSNHVPTDVRETLRHLIPKPGGN